MERTRVGKLIASFLPEEIAEKLGCSPHTVITWQSGRHLPPRKWITKIAEATGIDVKRLQAAYANDYSQRRKKRGAKQAEKEED